ncbi:hypothetical protein FCH33_16095 [Serratia fonticola]|uniref:hypothetical protein n=1 Tax=Serratia fonticola TaxID=47917 RepID=UPI000F9E3048|nr:hypothetical protein [Serratia fonticola]NTY88304.1 hypothetical protein [Serratia fonticola]NTZ13975.1 hypothetical protein [Serratia fonticola]HBE9177755.1 hypothetical protein [Serratia fonticola]
MLDRDFEHLTTLLDLFFEREEIRQKLNIIDQHDISGWEVWMQIEFANLLTTTSHEWWREQTLYCDLRKNPVRRTVRPDFLLRKKGWAQESYIALEMKQNIDSTSCIKNMISDLVKTAKIKSSEIELRSFWTLGITRTIEKDRLDYLIDKYLDDKYYLTKSRKKHVLLKEIDQTPFCYIVI